MADKTTIEWTDATWNVVNGCTVHSPGCTNCYAMKQAHRFPPRQGLTVKTNGGMVWTGEVRFNEAVLTQPLRWKRPRRIFVCAHGDLFHEKVPDEWIDRVFAVMALCPQHQFQVLTKRSARMRDWLLADRRDEMNNHAGTMMHWDDMPSADWPLPNVWLGVSVEDQQRADERVPDLLATPAAVRWLSCEPLLGPVDLTAINVHLRPDYLASNQPSGRGAHLDSLNGWYRSPSTRYRIDRDPPAKLDWIVVGGESGPKARPMHPDWARSLRDQCEAAGVPFLFKQWGEWVPFGDGDGPFTRDDPESNPKLDSRHVMQAGERPGAENLMIRVGKKRAGRLLDGVEHDGFPVVTA